MPASKALGKHFAETQSQRPDLLQPISVSRAHLIERFSNKKQCRLVATRYDKFAANYLAFLRLASIRIWLRANESTPKSAPTTTPGANIVSISFLALTAG